MMCFTVIDFVFTSIEHTSFSFLFIWLPQGLGSRGMNCRVLFLLIDIIIFRKYRYKIKIQQLMPSPATKCLLPHQSLSCQRVFNILVKHKILWNGAVEEETAWRRPWVWNASSGLWRIHINWKSRVILSLWISSLCQTTRALNSLCDAI